MEETGDAVLDDEAMQRNILAKNTIRSTAATRGSKRVSMPPVGQEQPTRMTRQRTRDFSNCVSRKAMQRNILANNTIRSTAGTRCSKRVSMPPVGQEQPTRMTRQRTRELSTEDGIHGATTNAQGDALLAVNCSAQDDEQIQTGFEGEPSDDLITQCSRGRNIGRDFDRICRGLNSKMPLVIAEGKRCATHCNRSFQGITLRHQDWFFEPVYLQN